VFRSLIWKLQYWYGSKVSLQLEVKIISRHIRALLLKLYHPQKQIWWHFVYTHFQNCTKYWIRKNTTPWRELLKTNYNNHHFFVLFYVGIKIVSKAERQRELIVTLWKSGLDLSLNLTISMIIRSTIVCQPDTLGMLLTTNLLSSVSVSKATSITSSKLDHVTTSNTEWRLMFNTHVSNFLTMVNQMHCLWFLLDRVESITF